MMLLIGFDGAIASDPRYLSDLLTPCRPVLWTWGRFIDVTVPIWERK